MDLTPRQLGALTRRHRRRIESQEFLFAQLTSYLINFSSRGPKEPTHPKDFMPSQWQRQASEASSRAPIKRRKRAAVAEEVRAAMKHFMRWGGG